jgi:hypothetical protein
MKERPGFVLGHSLAHNKLHRILQHKYDITSIYVRDWRWQSNSPISTVGYSVIGILLDVTIPNICRPEINETQHWRLFFINETCNSGMQRPRDEIWSHNPTGCSPWRAIAKPACRDVGSVLFVFEWIIIGMMSNEG